VRASTFFFVVLSLAVVCLTWDIHTQIVPQVVTSIEQVTKDADDLKVMTNAAIFQAEEVLHHTDELLAVERTAQREQLTKTDKVLDQLADTLANIDRNTAASLQSIPPLLDQTKQTLQGTVTLQAQLEKNLKDLEPAEREVSDIAVNLSNTTADVQHEVHKLVYPPPRKWYQKYLLDPLKIGLHLITIPVTNI
jgi:DNA repair ATPase RecN